MKDLEFITELEARRYDRQEVTPYRLNLVRLSDADLVDLVALQDEIRAHLDDPRLFKGTSIDEYGDLLEEGSCEMYGIEHDGRLAAYITILAKGNSLYLAPHTDFTPEEMSGIFYLKAVAVHPDYRGNGLQGVLTCHVMDELRKRGFEGVVLTVAPTNEASLQNFERLGFERYREIKVFDDADRTLMYKKIDD